MNLHSVILKLNLLPHDDQDFQLPLPEPYWISHAKLNNLVNDVNLTKSQSELLSSWLKNWVMNIVNIFIGHFCHGKTTEENHHLPC